jgi:hypothetical protein
VKNQPSHNRANTSDVIIIQLIRLYYSFNHTFIEIGQACHRFPVLLLSVIFGKRICAEAMDTEHADV